MGLFFYTKKGSIISTVDLPTTEIIEPFLTYVMLYNIYKVLKKGLELGSSPLSINIPYCFNRVTYYNTVILFSIGIKT